MLTVGASLTVVGIFLELKGLSGGSFLKGAGIGSLLAFVYTFYKHLKSNNETTAK